MEGCTPCEICGKKLYRPANIIRHYKLQHKVNYSDIGTNCTKCGWHLEDVQTLLQHKSCYPSGTVQCPDCEVNVQYSELHNHFFYNHIRKCPVCAEIFSSLLELENHFLLHHCDLSGACNVDLSSYIQIGSAPRLSDSSDSEEEGIVEEEEVVNNPIRVQNAHWTIKQTVPQNKKTKFGIIDFKLSCYPKETPNLNTHSETVVYFKTIFDSLLTSLKETIPAGSKMKLIIEGGMIDHAVTLPTTVPSDYTLQMVFDHLESTLNSNQNFSLERGLKINLLAVKPPSGSGRTKLDDYTSVEQFLIRKNAIISCKNKDNLCLGRAILIALMCMVHKSCLVNCSEAQKIQLEKERKQYLRDTDGMLSKQALKLHQDVGVITEAGCGKKELEMFQVYFTARNIQLCVYTADSRTNKSDTLPVFFEGPTNEKRINLFLHDGHFSTVTNLDALHGAVKYCTVCRKAYHQVFTHRKCNIYCNCCFSIHESNMKTDVAVKCEVCHRYFKNSQCFKLHKLNNPKTLKKGQTVCDYIRHCKICSLSYRATQKHICGKPCKVCGKRVINSYDNMKHKCFMSPKKSAISTESSSHIYYDIESAMEKIDSNQDNYLGVHVPVLLIAQKICSSCIDKEVQKRDDNCTSCEYMEFEGVQCCDSFIEWLVLKKNHNSLVIGHNAGRYDLHLLLKAIYKRNKNVKLLDVGTKILSLELPRHKIKFLDSINFIKQPLNKFSQMFKLKEEKGYFPHHFNSLENYLKKYKGPYPPKEDYGFDNMSGYVDSATGEICGQRGRFLKWYQSIEEDAVFDLHAELIQYCRKDVELLTSGCLIYRSMFEQITDIDFFQAGVTAAQNCLAFFRDKCIQEEEIAILYRQQSENNDKQSKIGLQWLHWMEHTTGEVIQKAGDVTGEHRISKYKVDGFCHQSQTIYSFYGCWFHGCLQCYNRDATGLGGDSIDQLNAKTMFRRQKLTEILPSAKIVEIWECQFKRQHKQDQALQTFLKELDIQPPLDPRECLFGGRVEPNRLYYRVDVSKEEKIKYLDITSLYPFVQKTGEFPIGQPTVIKKDFQPLEELNKYWSYEGIANVRILPPKNLFHPVLPSRLKNGKLVFTLCRKCATDFNIKHSCLHNDYERSLVGVYCSPEIRLALEKGYKILRVFEVYQFDRTKKWDGKNIDSGLFTKYVMTLMKLKQQASGWPAWVKSDKDEEKYLLNYFKEEGIILDPKEIMDNPGLRAIIKIAINCLYGKLAQKSNLPSTSVFSEVEPFLNTVFDPSLNILHFFEVGDKAIVTSEKKENYRDIKSPTTNVILAGYITALARIELYHALDLLGQRTCYYDTDSIMFISIPGLPEPKIGDCLGDWKSELGQGNFIKELVVAGCKNYSILKDSPEKGRDTTTVVKGWNLHWTNSLKIKHDAIRDLVTEYDQDSDINTSITLNERDCFERNKENPGIYVKEQKKMYRVLIDKRVVKENYITYPFGYNIS